MSLDHNPSGEAALRSQAESLLGSECADAEDLSGMSLQDIAALVHELRVHQIELNMQNDELRRIQAELETTRDRYAHLYDFAPVGYLSVSDRGIIAAANLTAAAQLESRRSALIGKPFSGFIHQADTSRWYRHRKALLETGNFQSFHLRMSKNNGGWFHANLECTRSADDTSVQILIAVVDISALKQAEEDLRQVNANLEQRVAQRTALAETRTRQLQALAMELMEVEERERRKIAELLHEDLQQTLACAKMQLEAACANPPLDSSLAQVSRLLEESIRKSRHLAHELSPAVLRHSTLSGALQWLARQMGEQYGLQVRLQTDGAPRVENLPLKDFLFRAVRELLFNVVKHAGVQSAQVALYGDDHRLVIAVSDQGRGVHADLADISSKTTGFGLLSLRERANYLGGTLAIDSAPGQGSRFTLSVPLGPAMRAHALPPADDPPPGPADGTACADTGGIRVLFVDDHKVMRQGLIQLMTRQPDIQVVGEAANGYEALEQARSLNPDVVVMDVAMPKMDGKEATRRIKAEMPEIRVIGLSMYADEQIVAAMRQAGADAFVSKTDSSVELVKAIHKAARLSQN